jgi:transcriptional regulator with XRE-family HTH domain
MSYDKVQVGNRIRGSRLEKGWTQERLAAEAEISVQQLRALEKGQRNLGVDHLGRLSDAMGGQQWFPAERLFWKQYIGLQDAGWPQEKIAATKANRRKMSGFVAETVCFSALQWWKHLL